MRTFLALLIMMTAFWQLTGQVKIDLFTGTLAVAGAWFISRFLGD
jgi:hypothetical protein